MTTPSKMPVSANDPHLHITPTFDNGVARFAAAEIATHLFNVGRWNGVDALVFQADPTLLRPVSLADLVEGDDYTIEGSGTLAALPDDEPVSQETQEITPVVDETMLPEFPADQREREHLASASYGSDDERDPLPGLDDDFSAAAAFTPSAAAQAGKVDPLDPQELERLLTDLRAQLVELHEQLVDAQTINHLQSDMLRDVATPRATRIESCTLILDVNLEANADARIDLLLNDGWRIAHEAVTSHVDNFTDHPRVVHTKIMRFERAVPVEPQPGLHAAVESFLAHKSAFTVPQQRQRVVERAVPLSMAFAHPLEAY